jgi:hypothetical protein
MDAELVGSGGLGDSIREQVSDAIESAIQKAADLKIALPEAVQKAATIESVGFADGGSGRLWLSIRGTLHIAPDRLREVVGQ